MFLLRWARTDDQYDGEWFCNWTWGMTATETAKKYDLEQLLTSLPSGTPETHVLHIAPKESWTPNGKDSEGVTIIWQDGPSCGGTEAGATSQGVTYTSRVSI